MTGSFLFPSTFALVYSLCPYSVSFFITLTHNTVHTLSHTHTLHPFSLGMNPLLLPEIILIVGAHLTRSEAIVSLRVCSLWHAALEPFLYHDFFLPYKQFKTTRAKKRKQRKAAMLTPQDPDYRCGQRAIGRDNHDNASKDNKNKNNRRLTIPLMERNAQHIRRLTTSSLQLLEHLSPTCCSLQKWTFSSHVDQRALFLIVMNRTTLRSVHLVYPRPRPIGHDEVNTMAMLFRIMDEQLTGLQELCLQNTRVEMDSAAGPPLMNLCRRRPGLHLDLRRFGVMDWPEMARLMVESQQQRQENYSDRTAELGDNEGTRLTALVPMAMDRLDRLRLKGIDQPLTLQLQLIRQCTNMTRLHWLSKARLLETSELGNVPFMSLPMLELGQFVSSEDTVMARMIELMPALEVLVVDLGCFGEKAIKAVCDKENQAWTNSLNGNGVKVCHLQEITLTDQKAKPRTKQTDEPSNSRMTTPFGDLLTHCRQLKKFALVGISRADVRTSTEWSCYATLEELQLQFYDRRDSWETSSSSPVVDVVDAVDEEDEAEFTVLLTQNVTRLQNIRILGLPEAIWMQLIKDANKNTRVEQLKQHPGMTWTLLDLVKLQEIDVLLERVPNPWRYRYKDVFEYLHSALRRMVPNLRRLSYDVKVSGFPIRGRVEDAR
ncbi:MAG: hypothetical protein JOS17DRAFT_741158, partial [Linnemannia elongata]